MRTPSPGEDTRIWPARGSTEHSRLSLPGVKILGLLMVRPVSTDAQAESARVAHEPAAISKKAVPGISTLFCTLRAQIDHGGAVERSPGLPVLILTFCTICGSGGRKGAMLGYTKDQTEWTIGS